MSSSSQTPSIRELRAARGSGKPSGPRRFRGWLIAGALLVALVLFGFFGLPPLAKARAEQELSKRLGREVSIEKIRINPLALSVTVQGLSIAEAAKGAGEFLGFRRVYADFNFSSLLSGGIGFSEISLDGFRAKVARNKQGVVNFDDILAKLKADAPAAEAKSAAPGKVPLVLVGRITVSDAKVDFSDETPDRAYATSVGPFQFSLSDFRTAGDPKSPYNFQADTASGERIAWKGTVGMDPVRSEGEIVITNLDLARLTPYFEQALVGELRSALLDVAGRYTFALDGAKPVATFADGVVTLHDVRFGRTGETADAFSLKRLTASGIRADSTTLSTDLQRVAVEGVKIKAMRDASGIDLLRLLQPRTPTTAGVATTSPALPKVTLAEFLVTGVQVDFTDNTTLRPALHRIDNLKFSAKNISSTEMAKAIPIELSVSLPQEGRLQVSGTATPKPFSANLDVELLNVTFANASPYVEPFLNIRLADGAMRAKGLVTFENTALTYAGDFGVGRFAAVDGRLAQDFLKWSDLAFTGVRLTTLPLALNVEEIRLSEASAALRIENDGTLNIAKALAASPAATGPDAGVPSVSSGLETTDKPARSAPLPPINIGRVVIEKAEFRFEDRSIQPASRSALTDFGGTITGLSSDAPARAEMNLSGQLDGRAPVSVTGRINPLGTPASADVRLSFKGIDLQPGAGPYVGKFVGSELERGRLNAEMDFKLQERTIVSSNVVTLDQFYLGKNTNSAVATKLPVSLALALLRDSSGKIVIDLPVKGSLDDPNFKIGRVVVRVLVNVITKAATSPFSMLGAIVGGGGGDDLAYQDFTAGSSALDDKDIKKLDALSKALAARPALNLDLQGSYDAAADVAELRLVKLNQRIRAAAWEARRQVDPNTPPPEALDITPALRSGMIRQLYASAVVPAPSAGEILPAPGAVPEIPQAEAPAPMVLGPTPTPTPPSDPRGFGLIVQAVTWLPRFIFTPAPIPAKGSTGTAPASPPGVAESAVPPAPGTPPPVDNNAVAVAPSALAVPATLAPEQMEAQLSAGIVIAEEDLRALAEARAQAVRGWLVEQGKVPAERVFLSAPAARGARVQLTLR